MREGQTLLHLSLSSQPRFHSRSFLFLAAPSSLSGVQQDLLREEDTSMLSACNRWQLWGRPWISAIAPVANYPNSSLGGPLLVTFAKQTTQLQAAHLQKARVYRITTFLIDSDPAHKKVFPLIFQYLINRWIIQYSNSNWPQMHILITSIIEL